MKACSRTFSWNAGHCSSSGTCYRKLPRAEWNGHAGPPDRRPPTWRHYRPGHRREKHKTLRRYRKRHKRHGCEAEGVPDGSDRLPAALGRRDHRTDTSKQPGHSYFGDTLWGGRKTARLAVRAVIGFENVKRPLREPGGEFPRKVSVRPSCLSLRSCQFEGKAHKDNARNSVHDALNSVGPMKPLAERAGQKRDTAEHQYGGHDKHAAEEQNL
jgi:hypothetical protein